MGLNDIYISSWQDDLVVSDMGSCDFAIVKATGGAGYKNECFERHAKDTLACGKLLGCHHYARDRGYEGSAEQEADWFIAAFSPTSARQSHSWTGRPTPWIWASPGPRRGLTAWRPRPASFPASTRAVGLLRLRPVEHGQNVPAVGGAVLQLRGDELPERALDRRLGLRGAERPSHLPIHGNQVHSRLLGVSGPLLRREGQLAETLCEIRCEEGRGRDRLSWQRRRPDHGVPLQLC